MKETVYTLMYSYQGKNILETVKKIADTFNFEQNLHITIIDHNNIDRGDKFNLGIQGLTITYKYVNWDVVKSPVALKAEVLKDTNAKWFMQVGDHVTLSKNWNLDFIRFLEKRPKSILSGNHKIFLRSFNPFFISKEYQDSEYYEKNNWFDRDFIFCEMKHIKDVGFPEEFKYFGEEELMSLDARIKGYEILSIPTRSLDNQTVPLAGREYVSFSLTHGYNNFIRFLRSNHDKISTYKDYCFNFEQLNYLPFENDDVYYDQKKGKFDNMDGTRYIEKTRKID